MRVPVLSLKAVGFLVFFCGVTSAMTFCPPGPDGEQTTFVYNFNTGRYDCITQVSTNTLTAGTGTTISYSSTTGVFTFSSSGGSGGGGASTLAVSAGVVRSSPTTDVIFPTTEFVGAIGNTSSMTVTLNTSSVTLQGPIVSSITLGAMYGAPTLTGSNISGLVGADIVSGIASGVLPSTIAYLGNAQTFSGVNTFTSAVTHTASMTVTNSVLMGAGGDSVQITSNTILAGATFYQNGTVQLSNVNGASLSSCNSASNALTWSGGQFGCNTITGSGGGGSVIAFATGTSSGFNNPPTSSPTYVALFNQSQFNSQLLTSNTAYMTLNTSSVTLQGPIVSSITLGAMYGAPTLTGTNITGLVGENIISVIPSGVLVSSVAFITSSQTFSGSNTFANSATTTTFSGNVNTLAGFYPSTYTANGTAGVVNANYTVGCLDQVIFASSTFTGSGVNSGITITLHASNLCPRQTIEIIKVDVDTYPVNIVTTGSDLIEGTTRLLQLNAPGQADQIIADGNTGWWPYGGGIQVTPNYVDVRIGGQTASFKMATSSNIYTIALEPINVPICVTGLAMDISNTGAALATGSFGILDQYGNVMLSTNSVSMTELTATRVSDILPTPVCIPPGAYNEAVQFSNTTTTIEGTADSNAGVWGCSANTATSAGIVNQTLPGSVVNATACPGVRWLIAGGRQKYN